MLFRSGLRRLGRCWYGRLERHQSIPFPCQARLHAEIVLPPFLLLTSLSPVLLTFLLPPLSCPSHLITLSPDRKQREFVAPWSRLSHPQHAETQLGWRHASGVAPGQYCRMVYAWLPPRAAPHPRRRRPGEAVSRCMDGPDKTRVCGSLEPPLTPTACGDAAGVETHQWSSSGPVLPDVVRPSVNAGDRVDGN